MKWLDDKSEINAVELTWLPFRPNEFFPLGTEFTIGSTHKAILSGGHNLRLQCCTPRFSVNFESKNRMIISNWVDTSFSGHVRFDFKPAVTAVGAQLAVESSDDPCPFIAHFAAFFEKSGAQERIPKQVGNKINTRDGSAIFLGARGSKDDKILWIAFDVDKVTPHDFTRFMINQLKVEI